MSEVASTRRPLVVALANKFLWELLLTEKWDHIFLGDEKAEWAVFPREISFCPTKDAWKDGSQIEGDSKLISYLESSMGSCVIVGMRKEFVDNTELWYPNSVLLDMRLLTKDLIIRHGSSLVTTPPLKVWEKK